MEFHYDLLEETKAEINEMFFFKDGVQPDEAEYEVIHDFEEAYNYAFEEFFEYGGEDGYTWCDILENNSAKVRGVIYRHENYAELSKIVRESTEVTYETEIEFDIDDDDVIEDIIAELDLCARSRFVCGKENTFFESVYKAYKMGAWPCGYRNGKIIVYVK